MILQRDGREVDEITYVKTSEAVLRMQRIADRLVSITPEISKCNIRTSPTKIVQVMNDNGLIIAPSRPSK